MKRLSRLSFRGFTLIELLIGAPVVAGYVYSMAYMTNNINHLLNNSGQSVSEGNFPQTTYVSTWTFKCQNLSNPTSLNNTISPNPAFKDYDYRTTNDPTFKTWLLPIQSNALYLEHGQSCYRMFMDPDIYKVYCNSPQNKYTCYSVTSRVQNSLLGISNITQQRIKSLSSDNRCIQSNSLGSPFVYNPIP